MSDGLDIIGDVHGCARQLAELLTAMGYEEKLGVFRHADRRVVFIGDLIDRGPGQVETVRIARSMVEAGTALIVAGNHEFNAIAFATRDDARPSGYMRDRTRKWHQHEAFLDQVGVDSAAHDEMIEWFGTMPLWLEVDGVRLVHACWDPASMQALQTWGEQPMGQREFMSLATDGESPEYHAVEHLLKGPEIAIAPGYLDKDGTPRNEARMNWWTSDWSDPHSLAHIPADVASVEGGRFELRDVADPTAVGIEAYGSDKPVFFGHYWMSGTPCLQAPNVACTDWSAVKGGVLAAYRFSGETDLTDDNWVSV